MSLSSFLKKSIVVVVVVMFRPHFVSTELTIGFLSIDGWSCPVFYF